MSQDEDFMQEFDHHFAIDDQQQQQLEVENQQYLTTFAWEKTWFTNFENWLLKLAYNPTYDYLLQKNIEFLRQQILHIHVMKFNQFLVSAYGAQEIKNHYDLMFNNIYELDFSELSANPGAIELLRLFPDRLDFEELIYNPAGLPLIEEHLSKLDKQLWADFSACPMSIPLLKKYPQYINWTGLSANPNGMEILLKNIDHLYCPALLSHPQGIKFIHQHFPSHMNWYACCQFGDSIELWNSHLDQFDDHMWSLLSSNPNAISILEQNPSKIDFNYLSKNINAIHLLEQNISLIDWDNLQWNINAIKIYEQHPEMISMWMSSMPNAVSLLSQHPEKIDWDLLSTNPAALSLLEKNIVRINWCNLSSNGGAMPLLLANIDKINFPMLSRNSYDYYQEKIHAFNQLNIFPRIPFFKF